MSGWGTKHDIVYEDPVAAAVRAYAAQSAAFYRALHARFDVAFEDFSDRDAGSHATQQGTRRRGSRRPISHRTCCTQRRSSGSRACGWWRGKSRSETR
jgi:hypothetical protein